MIALRPAVFLDRDGTLIEDRSYLSDPAGVRLLPGAGAAVARLNAAGIPVILVTNQSGIGRGYFTESDYQAVHDRVVELLKREGAHLDAAYHCPHAPDIHPPCQCRKPRAALFQRAAADHQLDLGRSYFLGDRLRDVLPGTRLGGFGLIIRAQVTPDAAGEIVPPEIPVLHALDAAVAQILAARPGN